MAEDRKVVPEAQHLGDDEHLQAFERKLEEKEPHGKQIFQDVRKELDKQKKPCDENCY